MGGCPPSLWHRFQRCTLSRGKVHFGRWFNTRFPPGFTQRVHLKGPESYYILPHLACARRARHRFLPLPLVRDTPHQHVLKSRGDHHTSALSCLDDSQPCSEWHHLYRSAVLSALRVHLCIRPSHNCMPLLLCARQPLRFRRSLARRSVHTRSCTQSSCTKSQLILPKYMK